MFNARTEELIKALEPYKGKRVFVAVLGSPDPDGLASAWALQILAREIGVSMDLLTFEVISRPDNVTFAKILDIPFRQVTDHLPRAGYAGYAVVDRQNVGLPVPHKARLPVIAHIDHHASVATDAVFMRRNQHWKHLLNNGISFTVLTKELGHPPCRIVQACNCPDAWNQDRHSRLCDLQSSRF